MLSKIKDFLISIQGRMWIAVVVLSMAIASISVFQYWQLGEAGAEANRIYEFPLQAISYSRASQNNFSEVVRYLEPAYASEPKELSEDTWVNINDLLDLLKSNIEVCEERSTSDEAREQVGILLINLGLLQEHVKAIQTEGAMPENMRQIVDDMSLELQQLVDQYAADGYVFSEAVREKVEHYRLLSIIAVAGIVILVFLAGLLLSLQLVWPLVKVSHAIDKIAQGDKDTVVPGAHRSDEMGDLARAAESFKAASIKAEQLHLEHLKSVEDAAQARREQAEREALQAREKQSEAEARMRIAHQVEEQLSHLSKHVEESLKALESEITEHAQQIHKVQIELQSCYETLGNQSQDTQSRTGLSLTSNEEASMAVQTLIELNNRVRDQLTKSQQYSQSGVHIATTSRDQVGTLDQSVDRIKSVSELIQDIAEQTNLLALNATIEAARAGDAGKGFAVVASEVKNLATQTAQATQEIDQQVRDTLNATSGVVSSMDKVYQLINQMADAISDIEEALRSCDSASRTIQSATTDARSASDMSVRSVTEMISDISDAKNKSQQVDNSVHKMQDSLATMAHKITSDIEERLSDILKLARSA